MEAVHQCSAQGLQFTLAQHSPEHQECCLKMALVGRPACKTSAIHTQSLKPQLSRNNKITFFVLPSGLSKVGRIFQFSCCRLDSKLPHISVTACAKL